MNSDWVYDEFNSDSAQPHNTNKTPCVFGDSITAMGRIQGKPSSGNSAGSQAKTSVHPSRLESNPRAPPPKHRRNTTGDRPISACGLDTTPAPTTCKKPNISTSDAATVEPWSVWTCGKSGVHNSSRCDWVYEDDATMPSRAIGRQPDQSRLAGYMKQEKQPVRSIPKLAGTNADGDVSWNDVGGGVPNSRYDYSSCMGGYPRTEDSVDEFPDVTSFTTNQTLSTLISDCGNEYLSVADVFGYVTLGGRLSDSDLIELGKSVRDAVNVGSYSPKRYVFITKKVGLGRMERRVKIIHYTMDDYSKMAQECLTWYSQNVRKVFY